jgi:8-oxo-dGTP diphosphatase
MRAKFPVAVHIFLIRDGEILLLRRYNTGYEDGKYSVVAGHVDGGETIRQASSREAEEEVGIKIDPKDLRVVEIMQRRSEDERVDFFLEAQKWSGELENREPQKCDQVAWFPLDDLPENTVPYVKRALSNYRQGIWFEEYGWE